MGVWGWDEIRDGVKLQGWIIGKANYNADDDDWSFSVSPDVNFKGLLTNQSGYKNQNGLIECEVEPPNTLNVDYLNARVIDQQWATVVGTFVRDRSHNVYGDSIGPTDDGDKGKTEIHPITTILVEHVPAADNKSRIVDCFVFSSGGSRAYEAYSSDPTPFMPVPAPTAPHTDENRLGIFEFPIPNGATPKVTTWAQQSEVPEFKTVSAGRFSTYQCRVRSGKYSEGQGFFAASIQLPGFTLLTYLISRGINFRFGIRELMKWAGVKRVRDLFNRLDTGSFVPSTCKALLGQIASLESRIADTSHQVAADVEDGIKPSQDKELSTEKEDLKKELGEVVKKARSLGCL